MAVKKTELYSKLWESCNKLRGGMDASQYKDYILTLLFIKYLSDKHANNPDSPVEIPAGATFEDLRNLKGQPDIGDKINKQILIPILKSNGLDNQISLVDFNDDDKLGTGKEKVDRLSSLVGLFEDLDFKRNNIDDDDILGDAYEFLMRHFATQSGKSKGQFYTPAEVSRVLSKIVGVERATTSSFSAYDPTCGSGSLLLKIAAQAGREISLYGQEKDISTRGLAIMNMWLHGYASAEIAGGNTLANPKFINNDDLKRFDCVVSNPPFSLKAWSTGFKPITDIYQRFEGYGVPSDGNGDYAFLLHIVASMKQSGKGAVILPHGVLFRGNAEATIRKELLKRRLIKGIIGLPANLFYGTGIPACIIVLDKEEVEDRTGVFIIDASKGFIKDGNKNRLREQDLHKIVDVFNQQIELEGYSRQVPMSEIQENEYNLNIPRYIDSRAEEDIQDLGAHLNGGIPNRDIEALEAYWKVFPSLKQSLFTPLREGYSQLEVAAADVKQHILEWEEFVAYRKQLNQVWEQWKEQAIPSLLPLHQTSSLTPKALIEQLGSSLLEAYKQLPLVDEYAIYQHLLEYWAETLKDDVYMIKEEGWRAIVELIWREKKKSKKKEIVGWKCDLLPKEIVIEHYLHEQQTQLDHLQTTIEEVENNLQTYQEEHTGEDGLLEEATNDKGQFTKGAIDAYIKTIKKDPHEQEAYALAQEVKQLFIKKTKLNSQLKKDSKALDEQAKALYPTLTPTQVQDLVIQHKWLASLEKHIQQEIEAISQRLSLRVQELAERYQHILGQLEQESKQLEAAVAEQLKSMGLVW